MVMAILFVAVCQAQEETKKGVAAGVGNSDSKKPKTGEHAYDNLKEPFRSQCIADWKDRIKEIEAQMVVTRKAIQEDKNNLYIAQKTGDSSELEKAKGWLKKHNKDLAGEKARMVILKLKEVSEKQLQQEGAPGKEQRDSAPAARAETLPAVGAKDGQAPQPEEEKLESFDFKIGQRAYDNVKQPLRSQRIEAWKKEVERNEGDIQRLKNFIAIDKQRAKDGQVKYAKELEHDRNRLRACYAYREKLQKNDPAFKVDKQAVEQQAEAAKEGANGAVADDDLPQLVVGEMKIGQSYKTDGGNQDKRPVRIQGNTWGQILQIMDDDNMLVGIDNGRDEVGSPRYSSVVWCKFPTKGLTDGKTDFFGNLIGTDKVTVTGTTRYKTSSGGTRTVFVLEPHKKK
jgi:hypothetical protein